MARIDSYAVEVFQGELQRARRTAMPFIRPGVDGVGVIFGAWHASEAAVRTVSVHSSLELADRQAEDLRLLVGTLVGVIDDLDRSWTNTLVLDVVPSVRQAAAVAGASVSGSWLLIALWRLLPDDGAPE